MKDVYNENMVFDQFELKENPVKNFIYYRLVAFHNDIY